MLRLIASFTIAIVLLYQSAEAQQMQGSGFNATQDEMRGGTGETPPSRADNNPFSGARSIAMKMQKDKPETACSAGGWTARVALMCPGQMKGMHKHKPYIGK